MDEMQPAIIERQNRGRLSYWAQLIKLLREPWPPRSSLPSRFAEPSRSPEPPRHPVPARFDEEV
jgi:hypothetical protein